MKVDQGSITPLVFTVAGGMGSEGGAFYSRLATLLSLKNGIEKSKVISWIRSKSNFALLKYVVVFTRFTAEFSKWIWLDTELEHTSIKK